MFEILSNKKILHFTKTFIDIDFDNLRIHSDFVQNNLKIEQEKFEESRLKTLGACSQDEIDKYNEFYNEEIWHISETLPGAQWLSTYLLSFAFFEKYMNEICKIIGRNHEHSLLLSDIKGKGVERAKIYLSKGFGVVVPFEGCDWDCIKKLLALRNVIAHTSGELDLSIPHHKDVLAFSNEINTIVVKDYTKSIGTARIDLSYDFNVYSIEKFRKFLISLCDTLSA